MNPRRLLPITAFVPPLATATAAPAPYAVIAAGTRQPLPAGLVRTVPDCQRRPRLGLRPFAAACRLAKLSATLPATGFNSP
jgi:hypothetical protein